MKLNIWIKDKKTTLIMFDTTRDGANPVLTGELQEPQILVEPDFNKITIKETK